jgi:hypothetical protein
MVFNRRVETNRTTHGANVMTTTTTTNPAAIREAQDRHADLCELIDVVAARINEQFGCVTVAGQMMLEADMKTYRMICAERQELDLFFAAL